MSAKLEFTKVWIDDDMMELSIVVCDGTSTFANKVYVGHQFLREAIVELHAFKGKVYGGIHDLRFGEFGPEYGAGAFHARMHFHERGKLLLTVTMQSRYFDFGKKNVSSEATLYLISEPALLDNFIQSLQAVSEGQHTTAEVEGIGSPWASGRVRGP